MSSLKKSFSNTDTGDQHPEPYIKDNVEHSTSMEKKLKTLGHFFERAPICMVSTVHSQTDELVSRCMGLAGKVRPNKYVRLESCSLTFPGCRWCFRLPMDQHRIQQDRPHC
jgi:hypothetical protein